MFEFESQSELLSLALNDSWVLSSANRKEFYTPEDLLLAISTQPQFQQVVDNCDISDLLHKYITENIDTVPDDEPYIGPMPSVQFDHIARLAIEIKASSEAPVIDVPHIVHAMLIQDESYASAILKEIAQDNIGEFICELIESYDTQNLDSFMPNDGEQTIEASARDNEEWRSFVTCVNDNLQNYNPLIGRKAELDRTILVLSRKDKNNPIHVGEPGVGKTALVYGLAARIENNDVPEKLKGCQIYSLDLGALLAGTKYRGDFEKRFKDVVKNIEKQPNAILYIDEIHNVVGAGQVEGSTMDASNMLKPYLESGKLRIMGATTYDEYKRVVRNKAFSRRFEKIDIAEPTINECKKIIYGLKQQYESFHKVEYTDEAIDYAVEASAKYITDRFLPDKAIDLIDEAGALTKIHTTDFDTVVKVDKNVISEVLANNCNVEILAEEAVDVNEIGGLETRILTQIFGQDKAVREVAEAIEMSTAGLNDDGKPMASLLFVGPTGVGKTEIARVLAKELHIPLLRYDMSEYAEKHTVAKLIGAPAGYVGYEDGGLLTDAIRRQPYCVLLLDEIEKAHSDIYNVLLQVMDYAMLTDNRGQKADFRHVVLIMTTNAGAQHASIGTVGFNSTINRGDTMLKSVKQTFKPEFINRLTTITVFNDINQDMASRILDKKVALLKEKLKIKSVELNLSDDARELLINEGFSAEYGGREIDRVINSKLKPLLMREILYGKLKKGGEAMVVVDGDSLKIT